MKTPPMPGLHHVTAITADAQRNIDFYCGVLGLRFVKCTVNFDDPSAYHLYYGDELGRPGTAMTFFAWNGGRRGRTGPPQVVVTQFAAPAGAEDYWLERLAQSGVHAESQTRFDTPCLRFTDPDGIPLEIAALADPGGVPPAKGPVPAAHALRGFQGVTLAESSVEATVELLTQVMGYQREGVEGEVTRYRAPAADLATVVDLLHLPDAAPGTPGTGVVHHVAFRTPDDATQQAWQQAVRQHGIHASPVRERCYFRSIYFHEPGGVLFEIATDGPGFIEDEAPALLGQALKLPPWLEPERDAIARQLPPLQLPEWN